MRQARFVLNISGKANNIIYYYLYVCSASHMILYYTMMSAFAGISSEIRSRLCLYNIIMVLTIVY